MLAYFVGVTAWAFIIWGSIATLIELWVTRVLTNYPISFLGVLVSPLIGLVFLWFERGLYAKKLGRLILVVLASGGGLIFLRLVSRSDFEFKLRQRILTNGHTTTVAVGNVTTRNSLHLRLAIGIGGIAKRKTLQDIK